MTTKTSNVKITRDDEGVKITEYNATQARLAQLEEQYKGVVFPVTTTKGMKEAKAARKELRDLRVALEKKRKDLKAPVLDYTRALDGQAKTLTARIEALEDPIDEQVKNEEIRKEREKAEAEAAERKRIDAHRKVIEDMRNTPLSLIGKPSAEIEAAFTSLQDQDLSGLEEFQGEASIVKDEAVGKLHDLMTQARATEEAAEREEKARREREEAEDKARREQEAREAEEKAKRDAELAELEELRRFKADHQEATRVPPEHLGFDSGAGDNLGSPNSVERLRNVTGRIDTGSFSEDCAAEATFSPSIDAGAGIEPLDGASCHGYDGSIPADDIAIPDQLKSEHEDSMSRYNEARDDLMAVFEGALTIEQAYMLLDAIIAGEVRWVGFTAE